MNRVELITAVAEKTGITKKDAGNALAAITDTIIETVANGDSVQILGFGTFLSRSRAARTGLNPRTKESIQIPASKQPAFKAGKAFKDAVGK